MKDKAEYFLSAWFRPYVWQAISIKREIKCEKCGAMEKLELHHKTYEKPTIYDLEILCEKCHRGINNSSPTRASQVKTIIENGVRYCRGSEWHFTY